MRCLKLYIIGLRNDDYLGIPMILIVFLML